MAAIFSKNPLTKHNLELQNQLLPTQHVTETITAWLEKLTAEEQPHSSFSEMSRALSDMQLQAGDADIEDYVDGLKQGIRSSFTAATIDVDHLKVSEQQCPFMYRETPRERFLTPESSDPSYFSRPTLANMGFRCVNMEGTKERIEMARGHMKATKERVLQAPDTSGRQP